MGFSLYDNTYTAKDISEILNDDFDPDNIHGHYDFDINVTRLNEYI